MASWRLGKPVQMCLGLLVLTVCLRIGQHYFYKVKNHGMDSTYCRGRF